MNATVTKMVPSSAIADISPKVSEVSSLSMSSSTSPSMSSSTSPTIQGDSSGWDIWTIIRYLSIILILAFLGFNLFSYLGDVTGGLVTTLGPALGGTVKTVGETTKQTTNVAAVGAENAIDIAADSIDSGINLLEKGLDGKALNQASLTSNQNTIQNSNLGIHNTLNKLARDLEPKPDDSSSITQLSKPKAKAGYCYIGEDRGIRSCMKVGEADNCMSGDIFPTKDICINPRLRQ